MFRKLKTVLVLVAGLAAVVKAQVPMQTTQDYAEGNRLIINGKPLFISGMNIAWNSFSHDVGDGKVDISAFVNYFKDIKNAGGNAVRWWLHTDAQTCPKFNESTGAVTGLGSQTINNIRQVLDSAYAYGIVVSLTLFSFDLLHEEGVNKTSAQVARNEKFLTVPANLDTYIENALKPMLAAVGSHPAIMCWEVFNEPEGMSSDAGGWSDRKIAMSHILRFTAKIAAEVHRSTKKMASTGIHEFGKMKTHYSNAKLKTASGNNDELAYLDFYMAHYYPEYIGASGSPFHNTASSWGMDRPVLIGEFPAQSWGAGTGYNVGQANSVAMTITAAYEYAYNNGYCGLMSWSITEGNKNKFGSFATTKPALENLYDKHPEDIRPTGTAASSSSRASSSSAAASSSSSGGGSSSSSSISSSSRSSSSSGGSPSSSSRGISSSSGGSQLSSSSNDEGSQPSSSSDAISVVLRNYQQGGEPVLKYYNLQGQPLGNTKPKEPGVYIAKNVKTGQAQRVLVK